MYQDFRVLYMKKNVTQGKYNTLCVCLYVIPEKFLSYQKEAE